MTNSIDSSSPTHIGEIFPLIHKSPNLLGFRLTPSPQNGAKEVGNRLSFHLSKKFINVVVTWHEGSFIALCKPNEQMPTPNEWKNVLEGIRAEIPDLSEQPWGVQWIRNLDPSPTVLAQLAYQILRIDGAFSRIPIPLQQGKSEHVLVRREVDFGSEIVELNATETPAISLSIRSSILFNGNLADFFQSHPLRHNIEELLVGLSVQSIEMGGHGTIVDVLGEIKERREHLLELATGTTSRQALIEAPDEQPVVGIRFGKNPKVFEYAMAALRPRVTGETQERFGVEYGELLKATKIRSLRERTELLQRYRDEASETLSTFGFQIERSINSRDYRELFWTPETPVSQTPILFGEGFVGQQGQILNGLKASNGGMYHRHPDYVHDDIQIAVIKLSELKMGKLLNGMQHCLRSYGFGSNVLDRKQIVVTDNDTENRANLEKELNRVANFSPDVVIIALPQSDRNADKSEGGSLYQFAYSHLLRRRIASQFIYESTLRKIASNRVQPSQILNQIVPGVLAKLGNLPFVLAEPLNIADYFIGLDVCRLSKARLPGTMNACASIRLYGERGDFVSYRLEDALIEGEEIPQRMLEKLLPASNLGNKTVLIYRDGRFCGREAEHILARAKAINTRCILVECIKSGVPRLYNLNAGELTSPESGLALCLSSREAILVTTKVSTSVGLARPLRLRIHPSGHQVPIQEVLSVTLKLTLLHHGALKTPRIPMPLYGADRVAYLKLNGIYPGVLEGDRQFWL